MADNDNKPLAPPPLIPPAPATPAAPPEPKVGEQYMVKHPSIGGQWQICTILAHPTDPNSILVQFPDGTRYTPDGLEIGGKLDQTSQTMAPDGISTNARVSPLNPDYENFRKVIVELNGQSRRLFGMPLGPLTIMMSRLAVERETESSGQMANYAGVQTFTPDQKTFDTWVEDYLLEVQRREQGQSAE